MIAFPFTVQPSRKTTSVIEGVFTQNNKNLVTIDFGGSLSKIEVNTDSVIGKPLNYIATRISSEFPDKYKSITNDNTEESVKIKTTAQIAKDLLVEQKKKEENELHCCVLENNMIVDNFLLDHKIIGAKNETVTVRDLVRIKQSYIVPKDKSYTKNAVLNNILFENRINPENRDHIDMLHSTYSTIQKMMGDKKEATFQINGTKKSQIRICEEDTIVSRYALKVRVTADMFDV